MAQEQDRCLLAMLKLKDNWSLTGELIASTTITGSGVRFSTRWYDESVAFPQVCVIPAPSSAPRLMDCGSNPTYGHAERLRVGVWVRPKQDSNTSLGWAKNASYLMKKEADRILESGSTFSSGGIQFFYQLGAWRILDELRTGRPVILRSERDIICNYYVKRSA